MPASPDLATAYAIQRALLGLRLAAGERVVGWKLGYTSEVMRRQMGIDRPNFGPLTDWMLLGSGDAVHERLVQPRAEPEIGLRLPVTALMALDAVAVRLHDSNHNTLGQGVGADADGHPLDAVARLARVLATMDRRLEAGDLVITGGLTAACALEVGGRLLGVFSWSGGQSIQVVVGRS